MDELRSLTERAVTLLFGKCGGPFLGGFVGWWPQRQHGTHMACAHYYGWLRPPLQMLAHFLITSQPSGRDLAHIQLLGGL